MAIVTGATNGIGEAAAAELARRGFRVAIVARNAEKAEATVGKIQRATPQADVDVFLGDLALMGDVRRLGGELLDRYEHIDVLINNAGVDLSVQRVTAEGLPEMVAVNYLAPWLLTSLLHDRLLASAPARVVNTPAGGPRFGWVDDPEVVLTDTSPFGGVGPFGSLHAYGQTKLLDVLFTIELAERLAGTGVTANCCCPGLVATGLAGQGRGARILAALSRTPLVRRPDEGARVLVRLATDPAFATRTGEFVSSTPLAGLVPSIGALGDVDLRRRLWDATARVLSGR
ncbi:MAG: SDR family NAD(P)-dependent oxidoreductase [Acidimicrobiales bacterium]